MTPLWSDQALTNSTKENGKSSAKIASIAQDHQTVNFMLCFDEINSFWKMSHVDDMI